MNREFQILYQSRTPGSDPRTINVVARNEDTARGWLNTGEFRVLGITELRAVVDWDKPVWSLDEYAEALNLSGNYLTKRKAAGDLPWNDAIKGVPSAVAKRFIAAGLNEAGKKFVEESE